MLREKPYTVGLLGQPNTGKSTLFNQLTHMKQHVGNWPGKTVEQKNGKYVYKDSVYHIVDLPGTYSLSANSEEELVTRDFVFSGEGDVIIALVDASQLERSLFLLSEFAGINLPVVVVFNMIDVAEQKGRLIEYKKIEKNIGVPVIPMIATKGQGIADLMNSIETVISKQQFICADKLVSQYRQAFGGRLDELIQLLPAAGIGRYTPAWLGIKLLENDRQVRQLVKASIAAEKWREIDLLMSQNENGALTSANCKYEWISAVLHSAVVDKKRKFSRGVFDRIATHPVWGDSVGLIHDVFGFFGQHGHYNSFYGNDF